MLVYPYIRIYIKKGVGPCLEDTEMSSWHGAFSVSMISFYAISVYLARDIAEVEVALH